MLGEEVLLRGLLERVRKKLMGENEAYQFLRYYFMAHNGRKMPGATPHKLLDCQYPERADTN